MPPRIRFFFAAMTATFFFIAAIPLYRELSRRRDIWWTPPTMLPSLAESTDRVQIYARGRPFAALLESGQVRLVEEARTSVLAPSEVRLRFNNWDRVRAAQLPGLLIPAAACGATALMFILVVIGRLAYRSEQREVAA
jgi:hypothetical protein